MTERQSWTERVQRTLVRVGTVLRDAVDGAGGSVDLAVHGHAHAGTERATTSGGVPVRNVAQHVIRSPYAVYELPGLR